MGRRKKCPNSSCDFEFTTKVLVCPKCCAQIDSSSPTEDIQVKKVDKLTNTATFPKHPTVYISDGVFSVQYWMYNRCFVCFKSDLFNTGEDTNFCTKFDCSDKRGLAIRKNEQFDCVHIQKVNKDLEKNAVIKT